MRDFININLTTQDILDLRELQGLEPWTHWQASEFLVEVKPRLSEYISKTILTALNDDTS